ncbi:MAG: hypothetical protein IJP78_07980 [Clostridia bacterium]|nr:hypothetical protein [Clostridia bacterium]
MNEQCTITVSEDDLMVLASMIYNDGETMADLNMQMLEDGMAQKEDGEGFEALMEYYRRYINLFMDEAAKHQSAAQAKVTRKWRADRNAALDFYIAQYKREVKKRGR